MVPHLLQMSQSPAFADTSIVQCAAALHTTVEALLLQQLQYLAAVRQQLSPAVQAQCRSQFKLLSSTRQLLPSCQLHVHPEDPVALQLLQDLYSYGSCGLPLLHSAFSSAAADEEQQFALRSLLGVKTADAAAVIKAVAGAHSSIAAMLITEQQRMQHLTHIASQLDLLESPAGSILLQQLQQAVRLQDTAGRYCTAGELHLPLGQQFQGLQADMHAAGMKFLQSSYLAAGSAGSAADAAAGSACAADSGSVAGRRLQQLLTLLGVKTADDDAVVTHIMQLYSKDPFNMPTVQQHMGHVRFICSRWLALSAAAREAVKQQLQLLVQPAEHAGAASSAGSSQGVCGVFSSSSSNSSSVASCMYAPVQQLLELPAAGSEEQQLLGVLRSGGAQFLHSQYAAAQLDGQQLLLWMRSQLELQQLSSSRAVDCILQAQAVARVSVTPTEHLVEQALYVALHGSPEQHERAAKELLLVKVAPSGQPAIHMGSGLCFYPCYYPEAGEGWQMKQVLLPSEVAYLHPAYVAKIDQLLISSSSSNASIFGTSAAFKSFLTQQMGVLKLPQPGSIALMTAAAAPDRWLPLLLLLRDRWHEYSSQQRQQLSQDLKSMTVNSSSGPRCLQECFLESAELQGSLQELLQALGLPFLQVAQPTSHKWLFLQALGVSTQLQWPDIHKALLQLSSSSAAPELEAMRELYKRLHVLCQLDAAGSTAEKVLQAFQQQQLLFVPQQEGRNSSSSSRVVGKAAGHQWLCSSDVLWSGNRKVFATKVFISWHYRVGCLMLPLAATKCLLLQ